VTIEPAPIEGVERTNVVVVRELGQVMGAPPRRDPYMMEVNRGRNCYACRGFGHIACHCRNQGRGRVADEIIKRNHIYENNLKEEENLESLD